MKVALATCMKLPEPDADEALLVGALERRSARVRLLPWDDDSATPLPGELVVIRSTWNYFERVEAFLAWVDRVAKTTRLANPGPIVRANARKTYLRDLETSGIDVVPTEYVMKGVPADVVEIAQRRGWSAVVIKPVVSAGSFMTLRFDLATASSDAQRFLDELASQRDVMVQRWMPSVDTYGERSLVWIDGELSHAIRKSPRFCGAAEAVSPEVAISAEERAFAERVLEPWKKDLLYARVDVVKDEDDVLRLMELELIEPSLFLAQCPRALERLADAIVARASA